MPTCNMPACHALMMCVAVGCILRDLFPDPNAILFLTRVNQKEFVAEFNALLLTDKLLHSSVQQQLNN